MSTDFLDNYEKHLLKNGASSPYEKTTKKQRVKDLKELKKTFKKKEKEKCK